ncbi:MAG: tyrosine-protein phosphatase [Candidatus Phosphoribacter sp.]
MHEIRWIDLDGVVNMRDVGGIPTIDGGEISPGRLIRSDNLQALSAPAIRRLVEEFGVTDIVDLRSHVEIASEGDGPLVGHPRVRISHFTLYADDSPERGIPDAPRELPWEVQARREAAARRMDADRRGVTAGAAGGGPGGRGPAGVDRPRIVPAGGDHDLWWSDHYLSYLGQRPDSVLGALRTIAGSPGAVVVHCAAGKDRTGTITGLALLAAGAEPRAVVDDFAASAERVAQILERLLSRPVYADNLRGKTVQEQSPRPETMERLLAVLDRDFGGVLGWLSSQGWTPQDTMALRAKLR